MTKNQRVNTGVVVFTTIAGENRSYVTHAAFRREAENHVCELY